MNYYAEDWWLEFLEGELEPSQEQDMALLLANSAPDREVLRELVATRELIKDSDQVLLTEDGRYYEQLHAKVMAGLRTRTIEKLSASTGAKAEAEIRESFVDRIRY